ncbi:ABC transporter substrate-binding protein [Kurthia sibirica]|uniref:ABC transporter substrate-binding protein n=1 Tax=Kurthia sibirica TaxID=202750 RepID=A0A2U3APH6_9BACL|nr:ABC transporter substrate-binding protein [Kurthia sibirica]PWI26442.1 ABC transporter substrate-binding protein [Kurthia sibirica]GEK33009.1 ABC transporter substrate-binding protein [Kurthia sibirica]
MKKKSLMFFLLLILVLSTALAACGGDKKESGKDADSSKEKTLVFGRGADSVKLDPAAVTDGESLGVAKNIFETLINFGEESTELVPGLATKWDTSDDGLQYTFELEKGVKFQDGTDFNAEAVVKNFERWMSGNAESTPYFQSMFGGFKGEKNAVIKEVKADGEDKVVITLFRAQAPFLKNLAMTPFSIASPTAFEKFGKDFYKNPVGTGPFTFVSWKRNDSITLEKYKDYRIEGLPKLDKVIFRSIPENSARLNALTTGDIDLADGINPTDAKAIESNDKLQLFKRPSMNVGYLGMTVTRKPFDDKKVRQAVNYAIDKQGLVDAFYEGQATVATNAMPPVITGFNEEIDAYPYDPAKAKALLKEAGYDGKEIELWAMPVPRPYMPDGQKMAEAIQKNLEDVGMKSKIVNYEWGTYLEKAAKGEADAFLLGWTGDNGDADNFLYTLLDEDSIGSNNYTFFKNSKTHKLLKDAQIEVDEAKREKLYKEAQVILHDEAPWVPLAYSTPLIAGIKEITGFKPHPTGSDRFDTIDIK